MKPRHRRRAGARGSGHGPATRHDRRRRGAHRAAHRLRRRGAATRTGRARRRVRRRHARLRGPRADRGLPAHLAAVGDDAVLGIVSLQLQPVPPRPDDLRPHEGHVLNMYVVPWARGRGVGRVLFEACLSSADALGVRRFHLLATPDGRPLYESAGFAANPDVLERRVPGGPTT
ncbi:MAG: GNAT family N-acetyltransferase [Acidimicrobiales bacterium]